MFGEFKIPATINNDNFNISIEKNDKGFIYIRDTQEDRIEKLILADDARILINPVEPLNLPSELSSFLLIEFDKSITIQPGMRKTIFLTFPIEIGVFLSLKKGFELFDVFSLSKQKFSLYGDPSFGTICKYWKSNINLNIPEVNPIFEGIIELKLYNPESSWVSIQKALFKAERMKIYYNDEKVTMKAKMTITDEDEAEIEFINSAFEKDMKKSIEIFTPKKLSVTNTKTVMLEGI